MLFHSGGRFLLLQYPKAETMRRFSGREARIFVCAFCFLQFVCLGPNRSVESLDPINKVRNNIAKLEG
jgi:hypothetical protein